MEGQVLLITLRKHTHAIYNVFVCKNEKKLTFFLFWLKTYIVGTRKKRLGEAVLTSAHNLCFEAKIRKGIPPHTPVLLYKMGFKGVYITRTSFRDEAYTCIWMLSLSNVHINMFL